MAPRSYRLEIWNRQNTARISIVTNAASISVREVLRVHTTLSASVHLDDPSVALLVRGSVLRVQESGADDFTLWRLTDRKRVRDEANSRMLQFTAVALWTDFAEGTVRQLQAPGRRPVHSFGLNSVTPTAVVEDYLVASYEGDAIGFQLGTVEAGVADSYSPQFDKTTPLAALRALEESCDCEASFRLDETGEFYHIDLLERIGSSAGAPELRYRKNIAGVARLEDERDVVTRLRSYGSGLLTLADARWEIASVTGGNTVTFTSDDSPVFEDAAFVGLWFHIAGKGTYPILASDASDGTIELDVTARAALASTDIGYFSIDNAGAVPLDYLESPTARAAYGVRVDTFVADDAPDSFNIIPNADLTAWTAGDPDGWMPYLDDDLNAPVITQSTDPKYSRIGGSSAHVVSATAGGGITTVLELDLPADTDRPYTGIYAALTIVSGAVRVFLYHYGVLAYGGGPTRYPIAAEVISVTDGTWIELRADPVHSEPLPAGPVRLLVVAHGGPAEFYLDGAMITPQIGSESMPFSTGSGTETLWAATAAELERRTLPIVEYQISVADLHEVDPNLFRFDQLNLGDDVKVRDPDIGIETMRIVEIARDLMSPGETSVVVAQSAATRVASPLWPDARGRSNTVGTPTVARPEPAVLHHWHRYSSSDGLVHISALANASTATLQLFTKGAEADPWPGSPAATITGRQGDFDGVAISGEDLFYKIVPLDGSAAAGTELEDVFRGVLVVTGITISFSVAGTIVVTVHADPSATAIYINAASNSDPATPTPLSYHAAIVGNSGTVDTGVACSPGSNAIVRVVAEDAAGQVGTMRRAELRRIRSGWTAPEVSAVPSQSGSSGLLTLTISDPDLRITAIEFSKKTGADVFSAWASSWDSSSGTIGVSATLTRAEAVALDSKHNSALKWRVVYEDSEGTTVERSDSVEFDADLIANIKGVSVSFSATGVALVTVTADEDTDISYVRVQAGSYGADPTSGSNHGSVAGAGGVVTSSVTIAEGDEAYVKVVGWNGAAYGPVATTRARRPSGATQAPSILANPSQSGSTGTLTLAVSDPDLVVTALQYKKKLGSGAWDASWTTWTGGTGTVGVDAALSRSTTAALNGKHVSAIMYRVSFDRGAGTEYSSDSVSFDVDLVAEVDAISLTFDSTGQAILNWKADEDTLSVYANLGTSSPPDPTNVSHQFGIDTSVIKSGSLATTLTYGVGTEVYAKARGYSSSAAGPVVSTRAMRGSSVKRVPSVKVEPTQSGSTGTLTLTIADPDLVVTAVEVSSKVGGGAYSSFGSGWDSSSGTPGSSTSLVRGESVALDSAHNSALKYRITFTGPGGSETLADAFTFDVDLIPNIQSVVISFSPTNEAIVSAKGDEDVGSMFLRVGNGVAPSDPTSGSYHGYIGSGNGSVNSTVVVTPGNEAIVRIRGYSPGGGIIAGPVSEFRRTNDSNSTSVLNINYFRAQAGTAGNISTPATNLLWWDVTAPAGYTVKIEQEGTSAAFASEPPESSEVVATGLGLSQPLSGSWYSVSTGTGYKSPGTDVQVNFEFMLSVIRTSDGAVVAQARSTRIERWLTGWTAV